MYQTLISPAELAAALSNPDWVVLDCRFDLAHPDSGATTYRARHISGAVYADLNRDLSAPVQPGRTGRHPLPDPQVLVTQVCAWGIANHRQVVVYDAVGGAFAARAWWLIRWLGHTAVAVLDGGWQAWLAFGGRCASGWEQRDPADFAPNIQPGWVVETKTLQDRLDQYCLLDARAPERYRGESEPLDPRAGHILGALSVPYSENLTANGSFKPPVQLAARFTSLLAQQNASNPVVCYCGSGVTACHNILAMVHAGLPEPQLYAGSWSEWCLDPARPIALGRG
jgi:thiosulfate/3-mercaptopyruvate sulfurtransferase